jgi:tyrosyl-tRNA synthetase
VLFSDNLASAAVDDVLMVLEDAPSSDVVMPPDGLTVVDLLTATKLAASKSEALRLVKGKGVYVNNVRANDERARLTRAHAIGGKVFVLRKGRKDQHVVRITS